MNKQTNRKKVQNREKNRVSYNSEFSGVWTKIKEEPKCPYCGSRMVLTDEKSIQSIYKGERYVCVNYPKCDCYCRTTTKKGERILISTPANKNLRAMRREAHFYLDQLENANIFASKTQVYKALSPFLPAAYGNVVHIGNCQEYGCQQFSEACIRILYNNRHRIGKFNTWENSKCLLSEEVKNMVAEMTLN